MMMLPFFALMGIPTMLYGFTVLFAKALTADKRRARIQDRVQRAEEVRLLKW